MAINVQIRCSDCGEIVDKTLKSTDTEIICPECQRVMPNLSKDDFRSVEKTLSGQKVLGILALVFGIATLVLLVLYVGIDKSLWVSGAKKAEDTTMFLYGAGATLLLCGILGALSSRTRYVVEF
ncbi:MAG TPA: hypothetical protein VKX17_06870 [Planctomycetota bacterium]|nr:hypothetical protein [Planctomycetota bacterium]